MSDLHHELKLLIVSALELEDVSAEDIDAEAPLFSPAPGSGAPGSGGPGADGLGLDSIDALELALAVSKTYGITIKGDDEESRAVLRSVASLARHIEQCRSQS